jgi:hypothetical protein
MLNAMPMAKVNRATRNNAVNALVRLARGRQRTASTMLIISYRSRQQHLSVDGAPVKSFIWKSRYRPNVQFRMLYLTNETRLLKLFKRPSYLSLNVTFSSFFHTPSTFGTGNGNDTVNVVNALVRLARGRQRMASTMLITSYKSCEQHLTVDGAPVKSNIWKSRYRPNVQLRMLYLTNETGPLKLFKRPSYL